MPPRGKNNPYYRTKEQLTDDVYNVLLSDNLSIGAKHAVIHEVTWLWTEFYGKYEGCPYWSNNALVHLDKTAKEKSKLLEKSIKGGDIVRVMTIYYMKSGNKVEHIEEITADFKGYTEHQNKWTE